MNRLESKRQRIIRRKIRVKAAISGTTSRPRLSVHISNKHITAQVIDDTKKTTLLYVSTASNKDLPDNLTEKAKWAGKEIAAKAKKAKISRVVLDRAGKKYHGRLKTLADTARQEGMEL